MRDLSKEPIKLRYDLEDIIDQVQKIRASNNKLWMDILRVAARHAAKDVTKIMKKITNNDAKITELMRKIK